MATRSLNQAMIIGNLTRDPELRYTPSGTPVCSFGVATNRSWMASGSDERQEETEFHNIVAWSKLAELCAQLLTKGRKVFIQGRLQTRSWETPDGEKRTKTEIVAEDMIILDSRRREATQDDDQGLGSQTTSTLTDRPEEDKSKEKTEEKQEEEVGKEEKKESQSKAGSSLEEETSDQESVGEEEKEEKDKKEDKKEESEDEAKEDKKEEEKPEDIDIDKIPF